MVAERFRIFIADGPRAGEYVAVDLRADGDLPGEVTLLDPRVRRSESGKPTSTCYRRVIAEDRLPGREPDSATTPAYREVLATP
jgi:hypothetical protein